MGGAVRYGAVMGLLIAAWILLMGLTGWYKDPSRTSLFFVVVLIEVLVLMVVVRAASRRGRTVGEQVLEGTLAAAVAAPHVFLGSLLLTTLVVPEYFTDMASLQESALAGMGMTGEQVGATMARTAHTRTPLYGASAGAVMTVLTGGVASGILALSLWVVRRLGPA